MSRSAGAGVGSAGVSLPARLFGSAEVGSAGADPLISESKSPESLKSRTVCCMPSSISANTDTGKRIIPPFLALCVSVCLKNVFHISRNYSLLAMSPPMGILSMTTFTFIMLFHKWIIEILTLLFHSASIIIFGSN